LLLLSQPLGASLWGGTDVAGLWELKEQAVPSSHTLGAAHEPGKGGRRHKKSTGLGQPQEASLSQVACRSEDSACAGLSVVFQGQNAKLVCQLQVLPTYST